VSELRIVRLGAEGSAGGRGAASLAEAWAEIVVQNFGLPPSFAPWLRALHGSDRWRLSLALDGETPVATGALYLSETDPGPVGQLAFGSTLSSYRRRGAQFPVVYVRANWGPPKPEG
jgi:hypothetical protein